MFKQKALLLQKILNENLHFTYQTEIAHNN